MSYNPNMLSEIVSVRPVNGTDVEFMIIDGSRAYAIMLFHARHYDDPDQFDPRDKMVVSREKRTPSGVCEKGPALGRAS